MVARIAKGRRRCQRLWSDPAAGINSASRLGIIVNGARFGRIMIAAETAAPAAAAPPMVPRNDISQANIQHAVAGTSLIGWMVCSSVTGVTPTRMAAPRPAQDPASILAIANVHHVRSAAKSGAVRYAPIGPTSETTAAEKTGKPSG